MTSYINDITNVQLNPNTYTNTIVGTVDLRNVPWVNNSMNSAFAECVNLTGVVNIESNVISFNNTFSECHSLLTVNSLPNNCDSELTNTFRNCTSLINAPVLPTNCTNLTGTMNYTFAGCANLVNAPVIPSWVSHMNSTFMECISLTDAPTIPNSVTNMIGTFSYCASLVNVPSIPNSVQTLAYCFSACQSLTDAPIIPNSVTNLTSTFAGCSNLVNAPIISDSITYLTETFRSCSNLVNAPTIPVFVESLIETFRNCINLTGNIIINSNIITNITNCFADTSISKNVYIPYYSLYTDKINTITHDTFVAYDYDENGTKDGVYLKNLTPVFSINTTSNIELEADGNILHTANIAVPQNTVVNWTVSAQDYITQTGTQIVNTEDVTLDIELEKIHYRLTVTPDPIDSTVKLESPGYTTVEGVGIQYIDIDINDPVTYTVSKTGYATESYTIASMIEDQSIEVKLNQDYMFNADEDYEATLLQYMNHSVNNVTVPDIVYGKPTVSLTVTYAPSDATLTLTSDGVSQVDDNVLYTIEDSEVTYRVEKEGYLTAEDTFILSSNRSVEVTIYPIYDARYIDEVIDEEIDSGAISDTDITTVEDGGTIKSRGY